VQKNPDVPFSPSREQKRRPAYAVASVDNALRMATWLQLEGTLTVSEAAARLEVAPSTAHRLMRMLVFRDFAVQDEGRGYRAGPVLEIAGSSPSLTARLRSAALGPLAELSRRAEETANVVIRTGDRVRFVASIEGEADLRVSSREGMVFPVERTSGGLVLLAALDDDAAAEVLRGRPDEQVTALLALLPKIRRGGVAVNKGRSEQGIIAVGRPVRLDGEPVAAVSIALPESRYSARRLPEYDGWLRAAAEAIEAGLGPGNRPASTAIPLVERGQAIEAGDARRSAPDVTQMS
jgi:DNA-binding IclR family transcriptional regulator